MHTYRPHSVHWICVKYCYTELWLLVANLYGTLNYVLKEFNNLREQFVAEIYLSA